MAANHLLIKGKVQGVFYRASAKETANELGIKGWIKNLPGGDVEIMATGHEEELNSFISWCRRGPKNAVVTGVIVNDAPESFLDEFRILK